MIFRPAFVKFGGGIFCHSFCVFSFPKCTLNHLSLMFWELCTLRCNYKCSCDDNFVVTKPKFTLPVVFASRRSHQSGISSTVCESILYLQHFPQELLLPPRISLVSAFSHQCWRCVLSQTCPLFLTCVKQFHDFITLFSLNNLLLDLKFWKDWVVFQKKKNCWFNPTNVLDKLVLF